jgi:hypothetical protein
LLGGIVAGVLACLLFAVAVPTVLSVQATATGKAWFTGGVPSDWVPTQVGDVPSTIRLVAGWRTPGPTYGKDAPFVMVSQLGTRGPTLGTAQWLTNVARVLSSQGWQPRHVTLSDGAPALTASEPGGGGVAPGAPGVTMSLYVLYAKHANVLCFVAFQTDAADYQSEEPAVATVFNNFVGSTR